MLDDDPRFTRYKRFLGSKPVPPPTQLTKQQKSKIDSVYHEFIDTPIQQDPIPENWGYWEPTINFLRRIGATSFRSLGLGIGVSFKNFALESQVYPTRGVVAMSAVEEFRLSSAVSEPRAFAVMLSLEAYLGGRDSQGTIDMGFGPMPDRPDGVDGHELARRYALVLAGILEKRPHLMPGMRGGRDQIEAGLLALLPERGADQGGTDKSAV